MYKHFVWMQPFIWMRWLLCCNLAPVTCSIRRTNYDVVGFRNQVLYTWILSLTWSKYSRCFLLSHWRKESTVWFEELKSLGLTTFSVPISTLHMMGYAKNDESSLLEQKHQVPLELTESITTHYWRMTPKKSAPHLPPINDRSLVTLRNTP